MPSITRRRSKFVPSWTRGAGVASARRLGRGRRPGNRVPRSAHSVERLSHGKQNRCVFAVWNESQHAHTTEKSTHVSGPNAPLTIPSEPVSPTAPTKTRNSSLELPQKSVGKRER